ncbi:MAG: DUF2505 domain-containing protein [Nocardioides sp.]|nr:DUF2505 domain-containing protein [Nocardioides sp.]
MKIRHVSSYPAPADEVHAMLLDPAYRERVCAALEAVSADVRVEEVPGGHQVRIDQVQPTTGVPSFAKKFAGETTRAVQVEEWNGEGPERRATLSIETPGKPTRTTGTLALAPEGEGTSVVLDAELSVTVPLIGKKLEGLMAELFTNGRDTEHQVGLAWLEGDRA